MAFGGTSLFSSFANKNTANTSGSLFGGFKPGESSFKFKNDNSLFGNAPGTSLFSQKNNLFSSNSTEVKKDGANGAQNSLASVLAGAKTDDSQGAARDSEDVTPVKYGDT